jgi:hypothetical protein
VISVSGYDWRKVAKKLSGCTKVAVVVRGGEAVVGASSFSAAAGETGGMGFPITVSVGAGGESRGKKAAKLFFVTVGKGATGYQTAA